MRILTGHPRRTARPGVHVVRPEERRWIGGVASGLGDALGVDPNVLRVAFVVLAFAGGVGIVLYLLGWVALPSTAGSKSVVGRRDWGQAAAIGGVVLGLLLLVGDLPGFVFGNTLVWPVAVAGAGAVLLWGRGRANVRDAHTSTVPRTPGEGAVDSQSPQRRWTPWAAVRSSLFGGTPTRTARARAAVGAVLLIAATAIFLAANRQAQAVRDAIAVSVVFLLGALLVFGPWLWRLATDLAEERRVRVRSEERAEVAAHLHDSVLHTLALVQRSADDPARVRSLARRQERELRAWIGGRESPHPTATGLVAALKAAAADVDADHATPIDVVTVGDCPLDDPVRAVVRAAREAMVNAAKHSGSPSVAVYAEVDAQETVVYVRDRGCGFDPDRCPPDRRGLADSVLGRMQRHGGTASVRSAPGVGTEVRIALPRSTR